jgi:hypothetical protein
MHFRQPAHCPAIGADLITTPGQPLCLSIHQRLPDVSVGAAQHNFGITFLFGVETLLARSRQ